jgi:hypothetical protein
MDQNEDHRRNAEPFVKNIALIQTAEKPLDRPPARCDELYNRHGDQRRNAHVLTKERQRVAFVVERREPEDWHKQSNKSEKKAKGLNAHDISSGLGTVVRFISGKCAPHVNGQMKKNACSGRFAS